MHCIFNRFSKPNLVMDKITILMKSSLGYNGISGVTMNYYNNLSPNIFDIDFIPTDNCIREDYRKQIENRNGKIYSVCRPEKNIIKYISEIRKILRYNKYNIIHINGSSSTMLIDVIIALCSGLKIRITHSHNTSCNYKILHYLFKPLLNLITTDKFACSYDAGKWVYYGNFKIINNGIDYDRFHYSEESNLLIRDLYNVKNKFVLCNVGVFMDVKNQLFLIDVFNELIKQRPESILFLIGDGPLRNDINKKIKMYNLVDKVILPGNVSNVERYYSASDIFILPSKYEGLPLSLIEAQVSGLNCIIADNIGTETDISGKITYISINKSPEFWADQILISQHNGRNKTASVSNNNYNIKNTANELAKYYVSRLNLAI